MKKVEFRNKLTLAQLLHLCQKVNTSIEGTIENIQALDETRTLHETSLELLLNQSSLYCSRLTLQMFREMISDPLVKRLSTTSQESKHRSFGIPSLACYVTVLGMLEGMRQTRPLVVLRLDGKEFYFRDFVECPLPENIHEGPLLVFLGKLKEGFSEEHVVRGRKLDEILLIHAAGCLQFKRTFDKAEVPLFLHRELVPFLKGDVKVPSETVKRICKGVDPHDLKRCFDEYHAHKAAFPQEAFSILHTFSE